MSNGSDGRVDESRMSNETDTDACRCRERATVGELCGLSMKAGQSAFLPCQQEASAPFDIDLFLIPIVPLFVPVWFFLRNPIIDVIYTVPIPTSRPLLPIRMRLRPSMVATKRPNILHTLRNRHPSLHKHRPALSTMLPLRARLIHYTLDIPVRGRWLDRRELGPHDRAPGLPVRTQRIWIIGVAEIREKRGCARVVDVDVVFVAPVGEGPAGADDARHLGEVYGVVEPVRRLGGDEHVDRGGGREGEGFCGGAEEGDVGVGGVGGGFLGLRDHAGGGVGADDAGEIGGEVAGHDAVAGAEIDDEVARAAVEGEDAVVEVGRVGRAEGGVVGEGEACFAEGCHFLVYRAGESES